MSKHPFDFPVPGPPQGTGGQAPAVAGSLPSHGSPSPPVAAVEDPWEPGVMPRVVDGIVVPAVSAVRTEGRPVYAPAGTVKTVSVTARAVGFYSTAGQWVLLWVGDDPDVRDAALRSVLNDLACWTHRR